ncbi:unnamed protein product, partial [Symbiodinium sp. KB8]
MSESTLQRARKWHLFCKSKLMMVEVEVVLVLVVSVEVEMGVVVVALVGRCKLVEVFQPNGSGEVQSQSDGEAPETRAKPPKKRK